MNLDAFFVALGALASLAVTVTRRFVPPFGHWFDGLTDENRQAFLLLIGVAVVAAKCGYDVATGTLPLTVDAVLACASNVLLMWGGTGGAFAATHYVARKRS
jgi:hypothetical protein